MGLVGKTLPTICKKPGRFSIFVKTFLGRLRLVLRDTRLLPTGRPVPGFLPGQAPPGTLRRRLHTNAKRTLALTLWHVCTERRMKTFVAFIAGAALMAPVAIWGAELADTLGLAGSSAENSNQAEADTPLVPVFDDKNANGSCGSGSG